MTGWVTPADSPRVGMLSAMGRLKTMRELLRRGRYREAEARLKDAIAALTKALENYHHERQQELPGDDGSPR